VSSGTQVGEVNLAVQGVVGVLRHSLELLNKLEHEASLDHSKMGEEEGAQQQWQGRQRQCPVRAGM
jgi:hypothetical protein